MDRPTKPRRFSKTPLALVGLGAGLAAFVAGGEQSPPAANASASAAALRRAGSCRAVRDRVIDLTLDDLVARYRYWSPHYYRRHYRRKGLLSLGGGRGSLSRRVPRAAAGRSADAMATEAPPASPAKKASGPGHYTKTNVQERGVDEADLVKTDGRHIYTVRGGELLILRSWPATQTSILARVPIGGSATKLFLKGDRLAIFSVTSRRLHADKPRPRWRRPRRYHRYPHRHRVRRPFPRPALGSSSHVAGTRITFVDVSHRSQPRVIERLELDGRLQQALMIGSKIYLVSTGQLQLPPDIWRRVRIDASQWPAQRGRMSDLQWRNHQSWIRATLRRRLRRAMGQVAFSSTLPRRHQVDAAGRIKASAPLFGCSQLYLPSSKGGQLGLLSVSRLDINQPISRPRALGLVARGWRVYASTGNLYLATARRHRHSRAQADPTGPGTELHKIVLEGQQGQPEYVASGVIPGQLLNQFSMSEHQGHLRVATTDANWRSRQGGNNLFVLREEGGRLKTVGQLRGLARGERIYAARMFGDKGYLVTFRRTDPLYTIDLSNAHAPRVVGELKVNGFSSYIHPLGKNHLLTIGQDADDNGRVLGMHLQIFDVSNFERPRRSHHYRFNQGGRGAHSSAQNNHHAFTYDPNKRVLAVPLRYNNYRARDAFNGLLLLKIGQKSGFSELGRISHGDLYLSRLTRDCRGASCERYSRPSYTYQASYAAPILRSIVIDDHIYSLSGYGLKVNRLAKTGLTVASVGF